MDKWSGRPAFFLTVVIFIGYPVQKPHSRVRPIKHIGIVILVLNNALLKNTYPSHKLPHRSLLPFRKHLPPPPTSDPCNRPHSPQSEPSTPPPTTTTTAIPTIPFRPLLLLLSSHSRISISVGLTRITIISYRTELCSQSSSILRQPLVRGFIAGRLRPEETPLLPLPLPSPLLSPELGGPDDWELRVRGEGLMRSTDSLLPRF
jgi:hypothetical protein